MRLIKQSELKKHPEVKRTRVGLYLQSGVEILDLAGPMEVFAYAGYELVTISKIKEPIYAQGILTVIPDYDLSNAPEVDILVFFGGNAVLPSKDKELIDWINSRKETKYHFSVCSGALILAETGILDNKQATTFRYNLDVLEQNYPKIEVLRGARYVDNGTVVTTAGVSAGIDGALHMIAKLEGLEAAAQTALYMEYDWTPNKGVSYTIDNPYIHMNDAAVLKEYEGIYSSRSHKRLELKFNGVNDELLLKIENRYYPIFYIGKDKFLTSHASHQITFKRDINNEIIGFETTEYNESFKKK
ncbi:DJ-1/PfpI family protein [uncultured Croceitalea sp.]|uniref:DJ-1/PfpI family protein n=1 Tax=uncultured Croceitalea sp. TaxID=1798908 RepID=UPI003305F844